MKITKYKIFIVRKIIFIIAFIVILMFANIAIDKNKEMKFLFGTGSENTQDNVKMKVSDAGGNVQYDSNIKNVDVDKQYKLYGRSSVEISAKETEATDLKYRFKKDGRVPSEADWKYITLQENSDVDFDHPNHLTQMPYDVSHMELRSNEQRWSNRQEVFRTTFGDKVDIISTQITPSSERYVTSEFIQNQNGQSVERWVPRTLFLENNPVSSYASGYREASKTWGYIKVPKDGEYYFKAITDDGFYGTITVDGKTEVIADSFIVKWCHDPANSPKPIRLEAGKYYPIYTEYFNWGGDACYKIECSIDNTNNYQEIGQLGFEFYPSKSRTPVDNANNGFMGTGQINFETAPGNYTIEYVLLKDKNDSNKDYEELGGGEFGKFEIEERFELKKSLSKDKIEIEEPFRINYSLKPKPILVSDLYKEKDSTGKPQSIFIKNIELEDELPEGLIIIGSGNEERKVFESKTNIEYKLVGDRYVAEECIFNIEVKSKPDVYKILFGKSGEVNYRDVSLDDNSRISQKQEFENDLDEIIFEFEQSEILKHGLFVENKIKSSQEIEQENKIDSILITKNNTYALGFVIEAKGRNNNFIINEKDNKNIHINNLCIYELNNDGSVKLETKTNISIGDIKSSKNGTGNYLQTGKKYAVVYYVENIEQDIKLIAKLDTGSEKELQLRFYEQLPELF